MLRASVSTAAIAVGGKVAAERMRTRAIAASGEELPVIGMGTWQTFDTSERKALVEVVRVLLDAGGKAVDSSPCTAVPPPWEVLRGWMRRRAFLATKVWTSGREEESPRCASPSSGWAARTHGITAWSTGAHLKTLRAWRKPGPSLLGITHYSLSAFEEMESIVRREAGFVRPSVGVRGNQEQLLPACAAHGQRCW
jgi:hypothetical protein